MTSHAYGASLVPAQQIFLIWWPPDKK